MVLWGRLFFVFVFVVSCGPAKDDRGTSSRERETRDRAQLIYGQFVGLYRGFVYPNVGDQRPIPVEMDLRVIEIRDGVNENGEPEFRPELRGYFHPTEYDLGTIPRARRPISGRYYEDRNQLVLNQTELSQGPIPDQGRVSISGSYVAETIEGEVSFTIVNPVSGRISVKKSNIENAFLNFLMNSSR